MKDSSPPAGSGLPPFASPESLRQHPRYAHAVANLTDGLASLYGADRRLIREFSEYSRAVTFMLAICIAAGEREEIAESWLTVGSLAALAGPMGIGPLRRVRRFIDEMRSDGHLIEMPIAEDRRRFRLRPTEQMLAIDRQWVATFHAPLALLMPEEPRYQAAIAGDRLSPSLSHRLAHHSENGA